MKPDVVVVGAGLAGTEAALQLAARGLHVRLYEQKPGECSPASRLDGFAELVCSNSFRAANPENAVGLLKEELERVGAFFMRAARASEIPAGGALAVDRERFSAWLTEAARNEPLIEIRHARLDAVPVDEAPEVVLASGPLTGDALAADLAARIGEDSLAFYDAIAPIVAAESIDYAPTFFASRYENGPADDYLNLPLTEAAYHAFVAELCAAEKVPPRPFEQPRYFEGCLPVDVMAERGPETLAFGPMKPVGLRDPATGERPYAVVQLRAENAAKTAYSLVGFQNRLKQPEQARVFHLLPGLEHAEFLRLGSVHRNTFLDAPKVLLPSLQLRADPRITVAGQLGGVEGYVESAASGWLAAQFVAGRLLGAAFVPPPAETALGALWRYLQIPQNPFQPSNVTYAMFPELGRYKGRRVGRKRMRKAGHMERARAAFDGWLAEPERASRGVAGLGRADGV